METFIKVYAEQLEKAVRERPEEYGWPFENVPAVVEKMKAAIKARTYNKDSRAFKGTCKILGIKHTYTAINHFIDNHI